MYNTPVILVQLGEHGVCDLPGMHSLPIKPANSSDTKACNSLSPVWQPHLKTWVTTKVEQCPQIRPLIFSWCPPRDAKNCDVCYVGVTKYHPSSYMVLIVYLLCQEQCSWAPTGGRVVLWKQLMGKVEQCSWDVPEVLRGINVSQTLTVITTTQSNTV